MEDVIQRLRFLKPGERLVYHIGYLDGDRIGNRELNTIANIAYDLAREHKIHLVQKRTTLPKNGEYVDWTKGRGGGFLYIAVGSFPEKLFVPFITNPLPSIRRDRD